MYEDDVVGVGSHSLHSEMAIQVDVHSWKGNRGVRCVLAVYVERKWKVSMMMLM